MNYNEAVNTLQNALRFGITPSLEPITRMCAELGNPQKKYECVQVAGTNGKSSTARITAFLLAAQGKQRVGLYTSPGLTSYNDRICVVEAPLAAKVAKSANSQVKGSAHEQIQAQPQPQNLHARTISNEHFAQAIETAVSAGKKADVTPTEFELLTAAALYYFAMEELDTVVLECGLGGRWDATSVLNPKLAIITGVGLDHIKILGNTLEQIAEEKAAIIKSSSIAVLAPNLQERTVFERQAALVKAPVLEAGRSPYLACAEEILQNKEVNLPAYQKNNIATALCAVQALSNKEIAAHVEKAAQKQISPTTLNAFASCKIPGRFEQLCANPLLIIDAAHNPQAAKVLAQEVAKRFPKEQTPALLLAILADKDAKGIVYELAKVFDNIFVTQSSSPRALSAKELAAIVEKETHKAPEQFNNIESALKELHKKRQLNFIATGSITLAGQVKATFQQLLQ